MTPELLSAAQIRQIERGLQKVAATHDPKYVKNNRVKFTPHGTLRNVLLNDFSKPQLEFISKNFDRMKGIVYLKLSCVRNPVKFIRYLDSLGLKVIDYEHSSDAVVIGDVDFETFIKIRQFVDVYANIKYSTWEARHYEYHENRPFQISQSVKLADSGHLYKIEYRASDIVTSKDANSRVDELRAKFSRLIEYFESEGFEVVVGSSHGHKGLKINANGSHLPSNKTINRIKLLGLGTPKFYVSDKMKIGDADVYDELIELLTELK